jgi:hypothetical protein
LVNDRKEDDLPGDDGALMIKADTEDAVVSIKVMMATSIVVVEVFIVDGGLVSSR